MKEILLLIALVFTGLLSQAQVGTDLEFSQVINADIVNGTVSIGTVPAGKIWKIVGYSIKITNPNNYCYINTGSGQINLRSLGSDGTTFQDAQLPLFIKENETVQLTCTAYAPGYVSIIEFTVLP